MSAYLDAELGEAEAKAFEAALAKDPDLQARLETLRLVDPEVRAAFEAPALEPVPERFRAQIEAAAQASTVTAFPAPRPRVASSWRLPLAAGLALAIGAGGGFLGGRLNPSAHEFLRLEAAAIEARNPLYRLLETTPSATTVKVAGADQFTPVLSFVADDGRACREFEVGAAEAMAIGVACRGEQNWRLEILLAADDRASTSNGYAPVSGYNEAALEAAISRLGAATPLGPEEEKALMEQGWRR
jgi:hypothetical protein